MPFKCVCYRPLNLVTGRRALLWSVTPALRKCLRQLPTTHVSKVRQLIQSSDKVRENCSQEERTIYTSTTNTGTPHKRREQYIPLPLIQGDLLFGIHPVSAALQRQHRDIYGAFFKVDTDNPRIRAVWELCEDKGIPMLQVTGHVMDQMVQNRPHQGVCLDVSPLPVKVLAESDIRPETLFTKDGKPSLWLLPFQVKDPMNMGAVLRSAHFFGVQNILLPHQNNADLSPVVSKASSGALEMLSIKQFSNGTHLYDTMQKWKDTGGIVVGSSSNPNTDKGMAANKFKMEKPTLLIIGNESYGLPGHITNRCDSLLHIEGMCESTHNIGDFSVDSLNVSAATAVLLYSVLNSR